MASSSVIPPKEKYDVFLSFRGLDTRKTFTSHLHAALIRRKVETYIDYRLERGDEVGPALYKAIEESKISVIIFSKGYASSTWCLAELAYILECKKTHGQLVIPIFYEVEPSHVRYQTGTYKTAFAKHEKRSKYNPDKVAKWKRALVEAANLSGFDSKAERDDSKLVEEVVSDVLAKLKREPSIDLTRLLGAEGRIQKILLELDIIPEDVRVRYVVLWGMGGMGKTTLAEAVYYGLSSQFETHYFLANVRERSGTKQAFSPELCALRKELLRQLLEDSKVNIQTPTIDDATKSRLRRAKVLVVLDDVNDASQLRYLAAEVPFGPGSRIIVTTRDQQPVKDTLLHQVKDVADYDVKIHQVEELNDVESLQLLQSNAPAHFTENSHYLKMVINHAAGVPLALEILRPLVLECKTEEQLKQFWARLKNSPNEKLQNVYRTSYGGLERNEQEIFLDIACFHKGKERCDAERILAACGLFPEIGIKNLIDMSLIAIKAGRIWMHDLIQEMGWQIVRQENPKNPGKRSRLHNYEDVRLVLEKNKGTANVRYISDRRNCGEKQLKLAEQAFSKMDNLIFLEVYGRYQLDGIKDLGYLPDALRCLYWEGCPLQSLPSEFLPGNLVELHMPYSKLKRLWGESQNLNNLKMIYLSWSRDLAEVGGLSNSVNIESIDLQGCESLVEVPDLSKCTRIKSVNLAGCKKLVQVPSEIPCNIDSLILSGTAIEELPPSVFSHEKLLRMDLNNCRSIKNFSSTPWKMRSLNHLGLSMTKIERVPSFSYMTEIISLDLRCCDRLVSLPADICKLKCLETLDLTSCSSFTTFPEIAKPMEHLHHLHLSGTKIEELPSSVRNLVGLKTLKLIGCTSLVSLPADICKLKCLETLDLSSCSSFTTFPEMAEPMEHLHNLNLSWTKIEELPSSVRNLVGLKILKLHGCTSLDSLPADICKLNCLETLDLSDCSSYTTFPEIAEPMEHLHDMNLSWTKIEELPSSVRNFVGLKTLNLYACRSLVSLPADICKMKCLETLGLSGCSRFTTFQDLSLSGTKIEELPSSVRNLVGLPADICKLKSLPTPSLSACSNSSTFREIAEPLEHLDLSMTKLKELPSSFGNLVGLKKLDLSNCTCLELLPDSFHNFYLLENLSLEGCEWLEEIPDCFNSFPKLNNLDLSGTMIETIPPSIKEASGLKSVKVKNCKRLQSLPELPCLLERLDAEGCTRLETVSVSVTAHTQGLDALFSERNSRTEIHSFLGCVSLDEISRSCIMDDARFRIMRLATIRKLDGKYSKASVICPGNEIPKWFSYQTPKGSSLNIKLPLRWSEDSNFLGIALCSVAAAISSRDPDGPYYRYHNRCEMILKTNNGETHTVNFVTDEYNIFRYDTVQETFGTDNMLVWIQTKHIPDEAKRATEASFNFIPIGGKLNMKKCGVCFLYAQDDDALKFEVIPPQQVTTTKKRRRSSSSEDGASGSQLRDAEDWMMHTSESSGWPWNL